MKMEITKRFGSGMLAVLAFTVVGCSTGGSNAPKDIGGMVRPLADDTVIVEFNGGKITAKDVNKGIEAEIKKAREELTEAYKRSAENMVIRRLLDDEAKKQGLQSAEALIDKTAQSVTVSDEMVKKFRAENKDMLAQQKDAQGKAVKVSDDQIRGYLTEQERQGKVQALVGDIRTKAGVKLMLQEPRVELALPSDAPFKGGASAKVVIHEFSDFECPFCARGKAVVDQIAQAYGDKVKIAFRHFPLNFHPNAKPAAIASICAHEQGKFWEFHDKLFANAKSLNPENYKAWAKEVGLDVAKFDACVADGKASGRVDSDMAAAEEIGVNSTPTFFVNGKKVAGALPFEQFKQMIDEELAKN